MVGLQSILDRLPQPRWILGKVDPFWIAANLLFGVLLVLFGYLAIRSFAMRFQTRGWFQRILDDISGTSVRKAEQEGAYWAGLTESGTREATYNTEVSDSTGATSGARFSPLRVVVAISRPRADAAEAVRTFPPLLSRRRMTPLLN